MVIWRLRRTFKNLAVNEAASKEIQRLTRHLKATMATSKLLSCWSVQILAMS